MNKKIDASFVNFIKNPQGEGVWSLNVDLDETGFNDSKTLLNLEEYVERSYKFRYNRFSKNPDERVNIPFLFPRLFAYLRACLPDKLRKELPALLWNEQTMHRGIRSRYNSPYGRMHSIFDDISSTPARLSPDKKKSLKKAATIFQKSFVGFHFEQVPEDMSKINFIDHLSSSFFQVTEEIPGQIKIMSPCSQTLTLVESLITAIPVRGFTIKKAKFFSPETSLMQIYLPLLRMIPLTTIVRDKTFVKNLSLALNEIEEQRYPHSIRATGIATEELLVEMFETYVREKAPEVPLGNLITFLNERIMRIVQGDKSKPDNSNDAPFKELGAIIESVKLQTPPDQNILSLIEVFQKTVLPSIVTLRKDVSSLLSERPSLQNISLFPRLIQDSLADIVPLRNRVSHRVDKRLAVPDIGYIEAAIAVKSLLMIGIWWYKEKAMLDYSKEQKEIISQTIARSSKNQ